MIDQTLPKFKIEKTNETLTSHSGLLLFGEFASILGIREMVDSNMPKPGSNSGFNPSVYVYPLLLMLHGGGRSLEDIRELKNDKGIRKLLPLKKIPSADAIGNWLRRMGEKGGLYGLLRVHRKILKLFMCKDLNEGYTLDIDATGIEANKYEAKKTYKGFRGYMPIVGHIAENGLVLGDEFREGNTTPQTRNLEFIRYCINQLPEGKQIKYLRSDSAAYQGAIIDYCEDNGIEYGIGGDLDESVKKAIDKIPSEKWRDYKDGSIADTVHTMNNNRNAFRLIVISKLYQADVFCDLDYKNRYKVIATNMTGLPEVIVDWYNQRGDCSENRIKDLKIGFGMERLPCGQFEANAVFFRIGVIAYNLYKLFVTKVLDKSWSKFQVQTTRWRLYQKAGKVVSHAGQTILKISEELYELFMQIRYRSWKYAMG